MKNSFFNNRISIITTAIYLFLNSWAFSKDIDNNKLLIDKFKNIETTLKIGVSNQNLETETPSSQTIFNWHQENFDFGLDLKYNFSLDLFTTLEYTFSKARSGFSAEDNVKNRSGFYIRSDSSKSKTNDLKLNLGYKVYDLKDNMPLFITAGAFYKNIKTSNYGGWKISDGSANMNANTENYPEDKKINYSNSKIYGLMLGSRFEHKNIETKDSLQFDFLLPLIYDNDQIQTEESVPKNYNYKNNKPGIGFRIKAEHGYKIGDLVTSKNYIKLYGFYEVIKFNGLTETQYTAETNSYYKIKGGTTNSVANGKSKFESLGAGISLEF